MPDGAIKIISSKFGIYYAALSSSLTLSFTDRNIQDYLGLKELNDEYLTDIFPELFGLENEIYDVLNKKKEKFSLNTINRTVKSEIFFNLHAFSDPEKENSAFIIIEDITEGSLSLRMVQQKRNEMILRNNELIRREEFITTLLNTIPDPVFYKDSSGRYIGCNREFENFTGFSRDDIAGKVSGILFPESHDNYDRFDRELINHGGSVNYEAGIIKGNGEKFYVIINKSFFTDAEYGGTVIVGVMTDITSRKQMEEQLQILGTAVEHSPVGIIITDQKGNIEYSNPRFSEISGYSSAEVIGQNPRFLKSGFHDNEFYLNLWNAVSNAGIWSGEILNKRKNGDLAWELASISPLKDAEGNITHYVGIEEDITELKETMNMLEANRGELKGRIDTMEKNLMIARIAVDALLQKDFPRIKSLDIECRYLPLEQIGGDFYSVIPDENGVNIFICDISGHGVAAALFLSLLKYFSESIIGEYSGRPGRYLEELNFIYWNKIISSYFFTAVAGNLSFKNGMNFTFANGGHPHPVLLKENGEIFFIGDNDTVVGVFENQKFREFETDIEKGDMLLFYTDGIPETHNSSDNIIGYDAALLEFFLKGKRDTLEETMDAIIKQIIDFRGETNQEDDILLLGFHYV
ncbi:MAG TPA: PAS domain S-box protein [Spirochaetota bacterium]|nr:PAS domain S-box protein [Spirochaetota bacterium]HPS85827.1 PAS domain S-box protein [Spirochaetota bacterium]